VKFQRDLNAALPPTRGKNEGIPMFRFTESRA